MKDSNSLRGLSPPTRGNLPVLAVRQHAVGSIPAHAGEPCYSQDYFPKYKVYPRPRGGTYWFPQAVLNQKGLSPPTRGNRATVRTIFPSIRSIPAHAGEPIGFPRLS